MISPRLALAIAEYLCRYRSVGLIRMTLDLLRERELRDVWKRLGVDTAQMKPNSPLLFKAMRIVKEHVQYLEQLSVAEFVESTVFTYPELKEAVYLPGIQVANWKGTPCGSPPPAPTSPPPENSTPTADGGAKNSREAASAVQKIAGGVQKGGRKRATIDAWL